MALSFPMRSCTSIVQLKSGFCCREEDRPGIVESNLQTQKSAREQWTTYNPTGAWNSKCPRALTYQAAKSPLQCGSREARKPSRLCRLVACRAASKADGEVWMEVVDPTSGRPYFWNTLTNETAWTVPVAIPPVSSAANDGLASASSQPQVSFEALMDILLATDADRFADAVNTYRPICFDDSFQDFVNRAVDASSEPTKREALEKLRARLANPLLKNPPPY